MDLEIGKTNEVILSKKMEESIQKFLNDPEKFKEGLHIVIKVLDKLLPYH